MTVHGVHLTRSRLPKGRIVGGPKDLSQLFSETRSHPKQSGEHVIVFSAVDDEAARRIKEQAGIDLSEYIHLVDFSEMRHLERGHAHKAESLHGQQQLLAEDVEKLPEIVTHFDSVKNSQRKDRNGNDLLQFEKRFTCTVIVVEAVRRGRKRVGGKVRVE